MRASRIGRAAVAAPIVCLVAGNAAAAATKSAEVGVVVRVAYACRFVDRLAGTLECNGAAPASSSRLQAGETTYRVYRFADGHVVCALASPDGWTLGICPASVAASNAAVALPAPP